MCIFADYLELYSIIRYIDMKRNLFFTLLLALVAAGTLHSQTTQVIAHRGFWKTEGSAQNSLASLTKADSIHCYGSELDVWLTADDHLVVNHDDQFKGVIPQEATEAVCGAVRLDNGEPMPTLSQYFDRARRLQTRLILELKPHKNAARETRAVELVTDLVRQYGYEGRMEYISFSLHAVQEFIRLAPQGTPVYYLNGDLPPQALKALGCAGPDYHYSCFHQHPEWIEQSHRLGMKVNAWTVNQAEEMQWLIRQGVDFITTNEPLLLQEQIAKSE